jgi:hypothetical protein
MHICSPATQDVLPVVLSHADAIRVQASWISDHVTVYANSFTHQSTVLPRKIPTQEHGKNMLPRLCIRFVQEFFSYSWQIHVSITPLSLDKPDNQEFTVLVSFQGTR